MPRAFDRSIPQNDHDPLKGLLSWDDQAQMELVGNQFQDSFTLGLIKVVKDLTGIDFTSWDTFITSLGDLLGITNLLTWVTDTGNLLADAWNWVQDTLDSIWNAIFGGSSTGHTPADAGIALTNIPGSNIVSQIADSLVAGLVQLIDDIWNMFTGGTGSHTNAEAALALSNQAATTADLAAAIAALQQATTSGVVGGQYVFYDFSLQADSTNLPDPPFTNTYMVNRVGGGLQGTGVFGVYSGRAQVAAVNDNPRSCVSIHDQVFDSDNQIAGGIWSAAPGYDILGNRSFYRLYVRSNAAGTSNVDVRLGIDSLQLGFWVAGVRTTWVTLGHGGTGTFNFKNNTAYYVKAGTIGGLRIYQVYEGSKVVLTYPEVGTSSQMGPGFRQGGVGVDWIAGFLGTVYPGNLAAWTMYDLAVQPTAGSGATLTRTSTTAVTATAGANLFPPTFFDTPAESTADITVPSGGKFKVTKGGWFILQAQVLAANYANSIGLLLVKNGTAWRYGGPESLNAVGTTPRWIHGAWCVPLAANDEIQLGYDFTGGTTTNVFTGDAGGNQTYFTIANANFTLN